MDCTEGICASTWAPGHSPRHRKLPNYQNRMFCPPGQPEPAIFWLFQGNFCQSEHFFSISGQHWSHLCQLFSPRALSATQEAAKQPGLGFPVPHPARIHQLLAPSRAVLGSLSSFAPSVESTQGVWQGTLPQIHFPWNRESSNSWKWDF